ncbi:MAG: 2OG-Fe(II) oxygenase [bacterium]|nr:2OG-Fe(II) oxygenase [bacterium]
MRQERGSKTTHIRADLDALERILTADGNPLPALRRLAAPDRLELLFHVELCAAVRSGPGVNVPPGRLLTVAGQAAASGALPLAAPSTLRRLLLRLETRLRDAGAWNAEPLWWSPLAPPAPGEELWESLLRFEDALPSRDRFAAASSERWLSIPDLLDPAFTATLHPALEQAHRDGTLDLERAGVGADGRVSASRSDFVTYLSGVEAGLPLPLAGLAQWCLRRLGRTLASTLPGKPVFPPQQAMLARYPAPSGGYHPHLDNPGGADDNGRTLTLVVYLNGPDEECTGGEIALWRPGNSTAEPATAMLPARGGSAVLFDARAVAHQVQPLAAGPARWALILWFSDAPQSPPAPPLPELSLTDVLLPVDEPPLPEDTVLFHEVDQHGPVGEIVVRTVTPERPRVGIVSTVYGRGAVPEGDLRLDDWCEHHLALGVDHLVLIFDHLGEPEEAATAERLTGRYPPDRLTVWAGAELAEKHWSVLPASQRAELEPIARGGSSSHAVAARQTLNAGVALAAAKGDDLGGAPLDWLLHLDADELFHPQGDGRGGASLRRHFTAASDAGLRRLRYLNHELLPRCPGAMPRFKLNPRLAAARLGPVGWSKMVAYLEMAQTDPRPYFTGYFNGKSAVAVDAGRCAAGVHGWSVEPDDPAADRTLAGPCVLHFHLASARAFRAKYLAKAGAEPPAGPLPFDPSPVEVATLDEIRSLRRDGVEEEDIGERLLELHRRMTSFDEDELELLAEAGLVLSPDLGGIGWPS